MSKILLTALGLKVAATAAVAYKKLRDKANEIAEEESAVDVPSEKDEVVIPVELPYEVWGVLALQAHDADMTLNDYIVKIVLEEAELVIEEHETSDAATKEFSDTQIDYMVARFLTWELPSTFRPDCGVSFEPEYNIEFNASRGLPPSVHKPQGTNLFTAVETEAMIRHLVRGIPERDDLV